jgi:hypothetical protein
MRDPSTSRKIGGVAVMAFPQRGSCDTAGGVAKSAHDVVCLVQSSDQGDFLSMLCY